jgi:GT2 family glycosyltransferase
LSQSIQDVRVLVIDDASSDASVEIASRLKALDRRVELIAHARNQGHIRTYNEGIGWAESDYFLLLSADDILVPGALERATAVMDDNSDIVFTYGDCLSWHDDDPFPTIPTSREYVWERCDLLAQMCATASNLVPTPTAIVRTNVQKAVGGYRTSLPHSADMEMWLRFAASGSVARVDAVQAIYRKHSSAMSNAYFAEMLSDYRQRQLAFASFFDEYGDRLEGSRDLKLSAQRALADRVFRGGAGLLRRGQLREGISHIKWSLQLDHRLRDCPPLWHLMRVPGPEGRERASLAIRGAAGKLFERASQFNRRKSVQ